MGVIRNRQLIDYVVRMSFVGVVLFIILRLLFIFKFGYFLSIAYETDALGRFFFNAFRFDIQVVAYLLLPLLPVLIAGFFVRREGFFTTSSDIFNHYFAVVYTVVFLISLIDNQFYLNFRTHFNPVFFEFGNEAPEVLIHSIWTEHPVVLMFISAVAIYLAVLFVGRYFVRQKKQNSECKTYCKLLPFLFFFLLPLGIRGSVSTFPLRAEDAYVSASKDVNDCVPNSVFMLKKAWSEKKKQFRVESDGQILKSGGFSSINEALSCYYGADAENFKGQLLDSVIFSRTPNTNNDYRPNVVLIITESWSNRLIDFQSDMDLLCSMDKHLGEDILFRNFQSSDNGTIEAVESFAVNTPYHPLFTSKYRYLSYPTAVTVPFKANGYRTEFVSGIELSWRNLSEVLPRQQFDRVTGKYELLGEMPDAECNNTWGVYDHSMLDFVANRLGEARTPSFFMCLTSSSHTPFEFPDNYDLPAFEVTPELMKNFVGDVGMVKEYLKGYQYSNRALGDFMTRIKSDKRLADNTVVIITGDHNIRMIFPYNSPESHRYQYSVPLYIYLPASLRREVVVDTSVLGSHHDIMTTIVPLLFSNTRYLNMGQNLFDNKKDAGLYYSINVSQVLHGDSLSAEEAERKSKARTAILKYYFQQLFAE